MVLIALQTCISAVVIARLRCGHHWSAKRFLQMIDGPKSRLAILQQVGSGRGLIWSIRSKSSTQRNQFRHAAQRHLITIFCLISNAVSFMHKQLRTWQLVQSSLQQKIAVMLLYVLESKGSSPGRQGFCMVVNADGEMSGSLGGGIMEHKFVELAKSKLKQNAVEFSVHQQLHDKHAGKNQSGMICSGEQTIFLYTVHERDAEAVSALILSLQEDKNAQLQLSPAGVSFTQAIPSADFYLEKKGDNDFVYVEKTGYKNHLYIIGGGHCALSFSQLMSTMDFYIHLFDDRSGLNTIEQNCFAQDKKLVDDYALLSSIVPSGKNIFVVIMTFGYRTDAVALRSLLAKDFKYLGVLGSKSKIRRLFKDLVQEGASRERLQNVYAPVGIPIKSQTPEEIAVSIAAEIIRVKNQGID